MNLEEEIKDIHSPFSIAHYSELVARHDYDQSSVSDHADLKDLDSTASLRTPILTPYHVIQNVREQIVRSKKVRGMIEENMSLALTSNNKYIRVFAELILNEDKHE